MQPAPTSAKNASVSSSWRQLFPKTAASGESRPRKWLVFKKAGEPLLIVPAHNRRLAARGLELYPAQSFKARLAKWIWKRSLLLGVPAGAERVEFGISAADPLVRFLAVQAGSPGEVPEFAILAGNPRAPGRRFLLLVFSNSGEPTIVVKTSTDASGGDLIRKETQFLSGNISKVPGLPLLRGALESGLIKAFALDYIEGHSPEAGDESSLSRLLEQWLLNQNPRPATEFLAWQRLVLASGSDESFRALATKLENVPLRPAVFHGDLAPWNIKVGAEGKWNVLDWERGEWSGLPGWDWFHYVLQPALLVQKQSPDQLANTAEKLLQSTRFQQYATAAGIAGHRRAWLLAYLFHCRDVLRPAEGSPGTEALLRRLAET
jgi:hypothetical protein